MQLIVGLGNDEPQYAQTRHNAGFMAIDAIAAHFQANWTLKDRFKAHISQVGSGETKLILAKPTTYYNNSGDAVRALSDFYKIKPADILVLHDELALPFGTVRARQKGSDAGNNGIKSIIATIGPDFPRIRMGISNSHMLHQPAADFVLGRFTAEELKKLPDIMAAVLQLTNTFIQSDLDFDHTSIAV